MANRNLDYESASPFIEAAKEAGRVVLLSIIPVVILGIDTVNGGFDINWQLVAGTGILTALKFADKWLHEQGKEDGDWKLKGLTRF